MTFVINSLVFLAAINFFYNDDDDNAEHYFYRMTLPKRTNYNYYVGLLNFGLFGSNSNIICGSNQFNIQNIPMSQLAAYQQTVYDVNTSPLVISSAGKSRRRDDDVIVPVTVDVTADHVTTHDVIQCNSISVHPLSYNNKHVGKIQKKLKTLCY